jgi:hypothetical protein
LPYYLAFDSISLTFFSSGDQATKRPSDQATKRPSDQATRRPSDQATKRPGDQATKRPGEHQATKRPSDHRASSIRRPSDHRASSTRRPSDPASDPSDQATRRHNLDAINKNKLAPAFFLDFRDFFLIHIQFNETNTESITSRG